MNTNTPRTAEDSFWPAPRTEIGPLDLSGPELDEGQLLSVTGGNRKASARWPTTSCPSGCHD